MTKISDKEDFPFRLTLEHYGEKITIEKPNSDLTIVEVVDMFKSLLKAAEFSDVHIKNINYD